MVTRFLVSNTILQQNELKTLETIIDFSIRAENILDEPRASCSSRKEGYAEQTTPKTS